jgi:hypothetical protein
VQVVPKCRGDLFPLVLPQQTGVHEDRHELVADCLMHQRRRHRRIHAARNRRQHAFLADLLLNPPDRLVDDGVGVQSGFAPQMSTAKCFSSFLPFGV